MRTFRSLLLILALSASGLQAQSNPPAQIVVTGRGEVTLPPDEATVSISVETRAPTAAAAGSQNADAMRRVREAIVGLGIPADSITTSGFSVQPNVDYNRGDQRPNGYIANNLIRVKTRRLEQVGRIIDAGLGAGASRINAVQFGSSRIAQARRTALAEAIAEARLDAEAMAAAGGGSLGGIIEMTTANAQSPIGANLNVQGFGGSNSETAITPADLRIGVYVAVRWAFAAR